ncbi:hypothetical protein [Stagnihabitans tardus]|uniref:Lysozyme inhibitor LprI N-terminal domain-containing protein n=1 Tax=Stagnihabitans tardus TaxID=2699202 RepID=A0AAE4YB04_9RHOB|nr:hypothetical protein [Stagnihabitans tardus]NBZ88629.1 hypothetical protein [Stagnihabitans tardus]
MIRLTLLLLMALPTVAQAEIDLAAEKDAQAAVQTLVESCLQEQWGCIGQAAMACLRTELAPIKPVFLAPKPSIEPWNWCYEAELKVWNERLESDIKDIREWLPDGPARRAFDEQQAAWTSYVQMTFPFDHEETNFRSLNRGLENTLPLVAMRALQVGYIRELIVACMDDLAKWDHSICKMLPTP